MLADKQCVRLIIEKAHAEQAAHSRKRFDAEATFRSKLLYGKMDDAIAAWCRRREIAHRPVQCLALRRPGARTDAARDRNRAVAADGAPGLRSPGGAVPALPDCRTAVEKVGHQGDRTGVPPPTPTAVWRGRRGASTAPPADDVERGIYQVAMYAATGGDPSRSWRYDCGLLIVYGLERPRAVLGEALFDAWPEVHAQVWDAARVWVILL